MSAPLRDLPRTTEPGTEEHCLSVTLLDLVTAISEVTESDREVVATVVRLLRSGRVRLRGSFRDVWITAS